MTSVLVVAFFAAGEVHAGAVQLQHHLERLEQAAGGPVEIQIDATSGRARFVDLAAGALELAGSDPTERSRDFFVRFGQLFGVTEADAQLEAQPSRTDRYGMTHLRYRQVHRGVPVFGAELRTHFDEHARLTAVNGTFVADLDVEVTPRRKPAEAMARAIAHVRGMNKTGVATRLTADTPQLVVYRRGLVRGVPGSDHLAWEVVVTNGLDVREFVYIDAHDASVIDRITGIQDVLHRTIHEPVFNEIVIWNEGDPQYDTGATVNDDQVNGLVSYAADVYNLFDILSGGTHLSWDAADSVMHSVWNATSVSCPNATWNGSTTNYCDGVASDDVVAHEWAHAYTQATHGLIYQWQPGALNESYSDIFGEVVDLLNGAGTDSPAATRSQGDCTLYAGSPPPAVEVGSPAPIAGTYPASGANFNPAPPLAASGNIQYVNDGDDEGGSASTTDGCQALIGFTAGNIALIDRGNCSFTSKVIIAQDAGAAAVIVVNSGNSTFNMGGSNASITIPSVMISNSSGNAIKAELPGAVGGSINITAATADTYRWLMGEDSFNFSEPIRDMWNPVCKGDPGKVSDFQYWCSSGDAGGVHTNSGVPNHAFALLVDGGTYNGQTVAQIGLTKATHLYWRAMSVYQVRTTKFADHASALTQSCQDLLGVDLADLLSGNPSGQIIDAGDCAAVDAAILAVELNVEPTQCNFQPLLQPDPPALSCNGTSYFENFDSDPTAGWILTNSGVFAEYSPRDWVWSSDLPPGGQGGALFAIDSVEIGNCQEGDDDQSGVMSAETPAIVLPASGGRAAFEHYVATEALWDGGNVKISVNGGEYQLVQPADFIFNSYNNTLNTGSNTNPMAGEESFTGSDGGEVFSTWGESQIDLTAYAMPGDSVRLRFDFGVDGCNGLDGWYLDNLTICSDAVAAGQVPGDAGRALQVNPAAGGDLTLSWTTSCLGSDTDYEIYEGTLGDFASHQPYTCSTAGATSTTVTPQAGATYYLVVPRNAGWEGSYGVDSSGAERPASAASCLPQVLAGSCL